MAHCWGEDDAKFVFFCRGPVYYCLIVTETQLTKWFIIKLINFKHQYTCDLTQNSLNIIEIPCGFVYTDSGLVSQSFYVLKFILKCWREHINTFLFSFFTTQHNPLLLDKQIISNIRFVHNCWWQVNWSHLDSCESSIIGLYYKTY